MSDNKPTLSPAPQTTGGEGAEWVLVPRTPTREMTLHACGFLPSVEGVFGVAGKLCANVWREMIEKAPPPPALSASPPLEVVEALRKAEQFIVNGVDLGFIRMPEEGDPAHDTLPAIRSALSALQPDRFGLPGSASTADAACVAEATTLVPNTANHQTEVDR